MPLLFSIILLNLWSINLGFVPVAAAERYIDETVTVPARDYRGYAFNTGYNNFKIVLKIEVLSGNDIYIHVTDETNFEKWSRGEFASGYFSKQLNGSLTTDITLGPEGKYYIILDNTYSLNSSKTIHITIDRKNNNDLLLFLGFLGISIVVGGFLAALYIYKRRSLVRDYLDI